MNFKDPDNEDFREYAHLFAGLKGSRVLGLSEEQMDRIVKNPAIAAALWNALHPPDAMDVDENLRNFSFTRKNYAERILDHFREKFELVHDEVSHEEGINFETFVSPRLECLRDVNNVLRNYSYTLISSQCYTGKSSLFELLYLFYKGHYFEVFPFEDEIDMSGALVFDEVIALNLLDCRLLKETVHDYILRETGTTLQEIVESGLKVLILVDELQRLYNGNEYHHSERPDMTDFFVSIKNISKETNIKVLCFASYGTRKSSRISGSPTDFDVKLNVSKLTEADYKLLIHDFQERNFYRISLYESTIKTIWYLTDGHVGYISAYLKRLNNLGSHSKTEQQQHTLIFSYDTYCHLISRRCSPSNSCFEDKNDLMNYQKLVTEGHLNYDLESIRLVKLGLATLVTDKEDNNFVVFNCPLASNIALSFISNPRTRQNVPVQSLEELVNLVFSFMRLDDMHRSLSLGTGGILLEDFWQKEFFYIIKSIVPRNDVYLSSEVQYFDQGESWKDTQLSGKVDFYLNSQWNWAIELLIEGHHQSSTNKSLSSIEEHVSRFAEFGKYKYLSERNLCKDYLVIDIRPFRSREQLTDDPRYANSMRVRYHLPYPDGDLDKILDKEQIEPVFHIVKYDEEGKVTNHEVKPIQTTKFYDL